MAHDEYRSALEASQHRVEALERELHTLRERTPNVRFRTPLWISALACIGGLACTSGAFGVLVAATVFIGDAFDGPQEPPFSYNPAPSEPVEPTPAYYGARWYSNEPQQVDIDGDGKKEIVGLFWGNDRDKPLYVAALDHDMKKARWVAGPYPSQWGGRHTNLVVTGDHVMVSDSHAMLHVLDIKTGAIVHDLEFPQGVTSACQLARAPKQILLSGGDSNFSVLDPAAGTLHKDPQANMLDCVDTLQQCKPGVPRDRRCWITDPGAAARSGVSGFQAYDSIVSGETRFTEGVVGAGKKHTTWSLVSVGTKKLWAMPAVLEDDTLHLAAGVTTALTRTSVISHYRSAAGDFRMHARDLDTGALLWNQSITDTAESSSVSFSVQEDAIFVRIDHRMVRYDPRTGHEVANSYLLY